MRAAVSDIPASLPTDACNVLFSATANSARVWKRTRRQTFGAADQLLHRRLSAFPRQTQARLPRAAHRVAVVVTSGSVRRMRVFLVRIALSNRTLAILWLKILIFQHLSGAYTRKHLQLQAEASARAGGGSQRSATLRRRSLAALSSILVVLPRVPPSAA